MASFRILRRRRVVVGLLLAGLACPRLLGGALPTISVIFFLAGDGSGDFWHKAAGSRERGSAAGSARLAEETTRDHGREVCAGTRDIFIPPWCKSCAVRATQCAALGRMAMTKRSGVRLKSFALENSKRSSA